MSFRPDFLENSKRGKPLRKLLTGCSLALALSACAGDLNPVRDVFVATGIGEERREGPDFVAETRPERLEFVPIGVEPPPRETAPKTAEEIAEMEEELRRLQAANEARAARARSLTLSPPPEPVVIEPIPELGAPPEAVAVERR
jgi:hypothetical protein